MGPFSLSTVVCALWVCIQGRIHALGNQIQPQANKQSSVDYFSTEGLPLDANDLHVPQRELAQGRQVRGDEALEGLAQLIGALSVVVMH